MRVALDVHALQVPGYADRGVGRYVAGYARALARRGAVAAALLAPELPPASGLPGELVAAGLVRWDCRDTCRVLMSEMGPPLVYHLTAPFLHTAPGDPASLGVVEHWARAGVPRVVLLHDLIPLRAPRHYLPSPVEEERYRARAAWVAGADLVLANSRYTAREAVELIGADPGSVVTVGAGVSGYFSGPDGTDEELWRFHLEPLRGRPYVLTVGGSDVRKGTDRAIAAFASVVRRGLDLALVVIGQLTDRWRADLELAARASGVGDRVLFLGAVDDELLRACYRRAALTVMPSLAEGAGLPVLESAACGTPALASSGTALAETAGVAEALFDPSDADSVADAIAAALCDPARRSRILAAQRRLAAASSWAAVAGRAEAALIRLSGVSRPEGWSSPPRLALVAGFPGAGLGVSPAEVAAALSAGGRAEVTCVGFRALPDARAETVALAAFGPDVRPASFDHVIYRLGPGPAGELGRLARRHPGWVWFDGDPLQGDVAALSGSARGFLVGSARSGRALELMLAPLRAHPPVAVLATGRTGPGPEPSAAEIATALLEAISAGQPPD